MKPTLMYNRDALSESSKEVCVMSVVQDPFTRGKCHFQYSKLFKEAGECLSFLLLLTRPDIHLVVSGMV